jgi:ankyrin repeat protein
MLGFNFKSAAQFLVLLHGCPDLSNTSTHATAIRRQRNKTWYKCLCNCKAMDTAAPVVASSPARPPSQFPIEEQGPAFSSGAIAHGSLVDFYGGIAGRIGDPSLDFYEQMRKEHCELVGCNFQFTSSNHNISTNPKQEWLVVNEGLEPACDVVSISDSKSVRRRTLARWWDCRDGHEASSLSGYLFKDVADPKERSNMVLSHLSRKLGLLREEVISIILFTGPMFTAYNSVLSKFPVDLARAFAPVNFTTTLHVIISAIQKLSVRTPVQSIVYRGTGGRGYLPDCFWEPQEGLNVYGYTEFGVMSMTSSKDVALEYSGVLRDRPHPAVLAFAAGAVDRGANVQELSQFPLEVEFTFPPLSYIQPEFIDGVHRVEYLEHPDKPRAHVPVIYVKVNSNIRSPTLDELNAARKRNHLVLFRSQNRDTAVELRSIGSQRMDDVFRRFNRGRVSKVLLASLKDAQHSTLIQDPVKTAFEGFLSVIHGQCEELLLLHEQKDETAFIDQFQHARLLNEMTSVRKWAIAKMLWYIEDESLLLVDILNYPLHKCFREFVSFSRARLKTEPNSDTRKQHAMFLCRLLGLVVSAQSEVNDVLFHDGKSIVEAVENGISAQDVELMLDAGFELESTNTSGSSLLSIAARFGHVQILEMLIRRGANVNFVNCVDGSRTPILLAAGNNHLNCLKLLLDKGATPSIAAVQMAETHHHTDCVRALNDARACHSDTSRGNEVECPRRLTGDPKLFFRALRESVVESSDDERQKKA